MYIFFQPGDLSRLCIANKISDTQYFYCQYLLENAVYTGQSCKESEIRVILQSLKCYILKYITQNLGYKVFLNRQIILCVSRDLQYMFLICEYILHGLLTYDQLFVFVCLLFTCLETCLYILV